MSTQRSTGWARRATPQFVHGFTLIELLITLAIAAVLLAMAVPAFREYTATQRVVSLANELLADVNLTRSESVRRDGGARLLPVGDGWAAGWRVEHSVEQSLIASRVVEAHVALSADGDVPGVAFNPLGSLAEPAGGAVFKICASAGEGFRVGRQVLVLPSGHTEIVGLPDAINQCSPP